MNKIEISFLISFLTFICLFSLTVSPPGVIAQVMVAEIVARSGERADVLSVSTFRRFLLNNTTIQFPPPQINNNGSVLFSASLGGSGVYGSTDDGVWFVTGNERLRVMREGDPAPGGPQLYFRQVLYPTGDNIQIKKDTDEAYFLGELSGPNLIVGRFGIWKFNLSGLNMVVRVENDVPGLVPAGTFGMPFTILSSAGNNPASFALMAGDIVWVDESQPPLRIQTGLPAPGTSGANLLSFTTKKSGSGNLLYSGQLTGGDVTSIVVGGNTFTNAFGLWKDTGNSTPQLILRSMDPLTADPNGPMIGIFGSPSNVIEASNGDIIFEFRRHIRSTGAYLGKAIYRWSNGTFTKVIENGDPIPGFTGVTFSDLNFSGSTIDKIFTTGSDVIVRARLAGTGVTIDNNNAILRISNGQISVLARGGQQAIGAPTGQTYMNATLTDFRVSQSGKYSFGARLQGPGTNSSNYRGIWTGDENSQFLALRQGPDMTIIPYGDRNYFIHTLFNLTSNYQINERGDFIVEADLIEVGDPFNSRRRSVIGYTPGVGPYIAAMIGQPFQTATGPTPLLSSFKFDLIRALNDSGAIALSVKFGGAIIDEDEGVVRLTMGNVNSCAGDFDNNGSVDVADIFAFLSAWFAQSPTADINGNGQVQVDDIFAFLSAWFEGC